MQQLGSRFSTHMHRYCVRTGGVLVYGGLDVNGTQLASVEMLTFGDHGPDSANWQLLPTPMLYADNNFASVPLHV